MALTTTPTPLRFPCAEIDPDELFCGKCGIEPAVRKAGAYEEELACDECAFWIDYDLYGPGGRQ